MRSLSVPEPLRRFLLVASFLGLPLPAVADDKPMGAPLEISAIETEQPIPLAIVSPDGKNVSCVTVKLHWAPKAEVDADDDATSFSLDMPADNPAAAIFTAQLWNASLASAEAWQVPWQGARWKVLQTPATNGSGIDAALAVGMISTSARRPYPKDTLVIGNLNPDGSLGSVSRMIERIDAAGAAGVTRIIIPSVQRSEADASGQMVDVIRHAEDLHMECVAVDTLIAATEAVMHDPLPALTQSDDAPKYGKGVSDYIDTFVRRERDEMADGLRFAPKESDLAHYPARSAAIWKRIYADNASAQEAYSAGQVYSAYYFFMRANSRMHGVNALSGSNKLTFDLKGTLATADELHQHLHDLMNPPSIDKGDLVSSLLVAEMANWAFDIRASLEGAQLVTKQAFSQRSDATEAEKDRARDTILFANEEARYLLDQADFYKGMWGQLNTNSAAPVDENASHLLPQLIPAQLATAQVFSEEIRRHASDMRDGLLFDSRLVAYVNVMKEAKTAFDTRQRKKEIEATIPKPSGDKSAPSLSVAFDPGNTYQPPHAMVTPGSGEKKLTDVSQCLIWVNDDCEIAALDKKYIRLGGSIDPATHEWRLKDRTRLDDLLQMADAGARRGVTLAAKVGLDTDVLAMIYERAAHLRAAKDEESGLEALRQYWRCALLGNMCWQLSHTRKAAPVDLSAENKGDKKADKKAKDDSKKASAKNDDTAASTNAPAAQPPEVATDEKSTNVVAAPAPQKKHASPEVQETPAPVAKDTENDHAAPRALPVTDEDLRSSPPATNAPTAVAPATIDPDNIPVARVAKPADLGADGDTTTNASPLIGPAPPAP